jgi:hypothetical protein
MPKYGDIALETGLGEFGSLNRWIEETSDGKHPRRDGAITVVDGQYRKRRYVAFTDALISEIGFPACDSRLKEVGLLGVRFVPTVTTSKPGDGSKISAPQRPQRMWRCADFKLSIAGLDCRGVQRIEKLTIKQGVTRDNAGEQRGDGLVPGKVEFPNVEVVLPESAAESWIAWHHDFVVAGNNGDDQEKSGSLVFLEQDLQAELCAIELHHLGIFELSFDPPSNGDDKIHRVRVKMYCERMTVRFPTSDDDDKPTTANGSVISR